MAGILEFVFDIKISYEKYNRQLEYILSLPLKRDVEWKEANNDFDLEIRKYFSHLAMS